MKVHFSKRFTKCLQDASDADLQAVAQACIRSAESFGRPHRHAGVGVRRLGRQSFECRVGLHLRLVFSRKDDALVFDFAGNHDEVQAYLKNRG